jgi:hypothetical protein
MARKGYFRTHICLECREALSSKSLLVCLGLELNWWTLFHRFIKLLSWLMAIVQSLLIIAARKHYSVDVVVAWYGSFHFT